MPMPDRSPASHSIIDPIQPLAKGPSKKNPARFMGRSRCNRIVVFEGSERHRGQVMDLRITRAGAFTLYGDPAILE